MIKTCIISLFFVICLCFEYTSFGQEKYPQVILLDNPAKLETNLVNMLPTGYSWTTEKSIIMDSLSRDKTPALFILQEGITDMDKIVEWAIENDKEEIYFFTTPVYPPDEIAYFPIKPTIDNLINAIYLDIDWKQELFDFLVPNALADSVPSPSCATGALIPGGNCNVAWIGGSAGGQEAPMVLVCFMFDARTCYRTPMSTHIVRNIIGFSQHASGGPTSVIDCLDAHNTFPIPLPYNFRVKLYRTESDPGLIQDCGRPNVFCAPGSPLSARCPEASLGLTCNEPKPQPLASLRDDYIALFDAVRNHWGGVRHEVVHHYGYGHCHMERNIDQTNHCIQGFTVAPGTLCNINTPQSLPPNHTYY